MGCGPSAMPARRGCGWSAATTATSPRSYPEVAGLRLPAGVVVDGELVALDERGRPDFALLQQRMHVTAPAPGLVASVPVQYVVFDLLHDGQDVLLDLPYEQRRARLLDLDLDRVGVVVPQNFTDTPGALVMTAAREQGLEGVVAKRLTSVYQPGRRSRAWVKTPIRHTAEVIIAGWSPSTGNPNVLGSLLLAGHNDTGELVYLGDVGTGFTEAARRHLLALLRPLQRPDSPFPRRVRPGSGLAGSCAQPWAGALGGAGDGRGDRVPGVHP